MVAQYDQREMGSLSRFAERLQDVSAAGAVKQLGIVDEILLLMLFATRLPACLSVCQCVSCFFYLSIYLIMHYITVYLL